MKALRYTLLSDGSSDQALIPVLTWLLRQYVYDLALQAEWADLRRLPHPPKKLAERVQRTLELYPCDLLFVHRDAENVALETRREEIRGAIAAAGITGPPPAVCVVPVRMLEAWLLFDLEAIRRVAGNPSGKEPLPLPSLGTLERLRNPKRDLHKLLRQASGLHGRRLKLFREEKIVHRIPDFIENFAPLRSLSAFQRLEKDVKETIASQGWR